MKRCVESELLDELPARDPRALRSRQDIHRLNAFMGHPGIMAAELLKIFSRHLSFKLVEIGGGDGGFLLRVARRLRGKWRSVDATVVDREDLFENETRQQFMGFQWQAKAVSSDVFRWLNETGTEPDRVILANLFLHQFDNRQLRELLLGAARKTRVLIAVEPRRSRRALFFSRLVWLLGCNGVTRHDAPVSVRAGFAGRELSALWPDPENWELSERPVGWFSHVFVARRKEQINDAISQPLESAAFDRQASVNSRKAEATSLGRPSVRGALNRESATHPESGTHGRSQGTGTIR